MAQIAGACGVYASTVKYWQDHDIPTEHVRTVAALLGVSAEYLAGYVDEDPGAAA